jgi:NitT/TauT family transport system substrate-binding protein
MTGCKQLFLLLLFVAGVPALCGCQGRQEPKSPLKLSLGITPTFYSGLVAIADAKGFFRKAGLDVSIKEYPSGLAAIEALFRGEIQMATAADFAFAMLAKDHPSLRILSSIALVNTNEIVAGKDRGIREISDLRGKKIGISANTISEYYLFTFLLTHRINASEMTIVNIAPTAMVDALARGELDAISTWDNYVYRAKKALGENAVAWQNQNAQDYHWVLVSDESLTQAPEPAVRCLRALIGAEKFSLTDEAESMDVIAHRWGFNPELMLELRNKTRLNVNLSQALLRSLEGAAEWRMSKDGAHSGLPNFLNYIYTGALEDTNPKAVTIFR